MEGTVSQFAGDYREWAPDAALSEHVRCLWVNDLSISPSKSIQVVPDGCVDIVWTRNSLRVAGPDTRAWLEQLPPRSLIVGIRFQPGVASAWLGVPLTEILNARIALSEFWAGEADSLFDRASSSNDATPNDAAPSDATSIAAHLEAALQSRLPAVGAADRGIGFVRHLAERRRCTRNEGMRALAGRIGLSERTLRRRCMDAFGYGFKTLDRILRFQRFFRLASASAHPRLAELADQAGYADQAHLTREVQRLCGATPRELVAQLRA